MAGLGTLEVLPTDILVSITAYLDTEIWTLRSVSKAFNSLLSDDHVVYQALKKHNPDVTMQNLQASTTAFKSRYTGIPQSAMRISFQQIAPGTTPVLEGQYLAFQPAVGHIRIGDLKTLAYRDVHASGHIEKLILTSKIVAAYDRRECLAWDLQHLKQTIIDVADDIIDMVGHDNHIGLITSPHLLMWDLMVYNADTGARMLKFCLNRRPDAWISYLQPKLAMNDRTCLIIHIPDVSDEDEYHCYTGRRRIPFAEIAQVDLNTASAKKFELHTRCLDTQKATTVTVRPAGQYNTWYIGVDHHGFYSSHYHHGCLRVGDNHEWQEMKMRGQFTAYWKGTMWTASGFPFYQEPHWSHITAERGVHYLSAPHMQKPERPLQENVKRIMQYRPLSEYRQSMELMASEQFLISYIHGERFITVYAFGDSSLSKTDLVRVELSRAFLDNPDVVNCWTSTKYCKFNLTEASHDEPVV